MSAFGFCISMVIKTNVVSNICDRIWHGNFPSGFILTMLRWKENCNSNLNKWMHFRCSWENCKYPNWIEIEAWSFIFYNGVSMDIAFLSFSSSDIETRMQLHMHIFDHLQIYRLRSRIFKHFIQPIVCKSFQGS